MTFLWKGAAPFRSGPSLPCGCARQPPPGPSTRKGHGEPAGGHLTVPVAYHCQGNSSVSHQRVWSPRPTRQQAPWVLRTNSGKGQGSRLLPQLQEAPQASVVIAAQRNPVGLTWPLGSDIGCLQETASKASSAKMPSIIK